MRQVLLIHMARVICALALAGCTTARETAATDASPPAGSSDVVTVYAGANRLVQMKTVGLGEACVVDGTTGPVSYPITIDQRHRDATLTREQQKTVNDIARYLRSSTLRFVFIARDLVVFDAYDGPCEPSAPGYRVLNGSCNLRYSPTDNFTRLSSVPDCWGTPYPWQRSRVDHRF
jgi:hypothetical protein